MVLLKYFNHVNGSTGTPLPNPKSSLNEVVDRKAIEAANEEVMKICSKGPKGAKHRLPYLSKYAAENGFNQTDFPLLH